MPTGFVADSRQRGDVGFRADHVPHELAEMICGQDRCDVAEQGGHLAQWKEEPRDERERKEDEVGDGGRGTWPNQECNCRPNVLKASTPPTRMPVSAATP